jgi:hypothetical protein
LICGFGLKKQDSPLERSHATLRRWRRRALSELARVLRGSMMLFTPTEEAGLYDWAEMIGLVLIERIEPLSPAATPSGS